ncbi:MAG: DUF3096 domain-containing protein [Actinobacteria bacterium]|nr:DUF3096 domain-containing protein [Actinomycetota bacterium]
MDLTSLVGQVPQPDTPRDTPVLIAGLVSLGLGILILVRPRLLNYIVAAYLIVVGALWIIAALD